VFLVPVCLCASMRLPSFTRLYGGLLATLLARSVAGAPGAWSGTALAERASTSRLVFAHFIVRVSVPLH